ncbi:ABC transporter substrate-binding protein [Alteromonas confluentis]|uniref:ABC transporter substrate-binding protein n=1 Tax=Alteromonas confluentis TaxID=1656094 RepID=UPI001FDFB297|nr:ABC transporter substrate-binding protein [Alteromonas confluentis]
MPAVFSFRLIVIVFTTLLSLTACTPPRSPDKIVISGPFEPVSYDPASSGYIFSRMQVIETLVDVNDDGTLRPGLATGWQSNDDFSEWTFHLREGVKFHDGSTMNAEVVRKSLAVAFGKPVPFDASLVKDITIPDAHTVVFTLSQHYRPFPSLMSNYTMAILSPASFGKFNRMTALIGTGPYKITDFQPPHNISTIRFDDYWGRPGTIKEVEYITGHRSETRALMVKTGQADIVYNLDPAAVEMLKSDDSVSVFSELIPRTTLIKLNLDDPILADRSVRQALSLALDRTGIASGILRVPGIEANQLFGPGMGVWHMDDLPPPSQSLKQAKALLEQAGWQLANDGVRYRNGKSLEMNMITYANRPELIIIATAIQDQWSQAGVKLNVHMENSSAIPSGHTDGTLQTALMARNFANIPDPLGILLADFTSEQGGEWGPMNWQNPSLFSRIEQIGRETSEASLPAQARDVIRTINDDLPLIPVVYYMQHSAVSDRLQHFSFDPYERSFRIADLQIRSEP